MPGTFKWLKQEACIDGEWDGIPLDGTLRQLKAGIGAGCSSLADAFWITLGAVSLKLLPDAAEQIQALRATVEFDSGTRIITHDLLEREISFLDTATGEVETLPVVPEGGERSAGSHSVTLMGIPVVETARGSVTLDAVMTLLYLQQAHAGHTVYGGANPNDLAVTIEVCFNLLDEETTRLKAHSTAATRRASTKATQLKKALEQRVADGLPTAIEFDTDEARLTRALDAANSEILRLNTELDAHLAISPPVAASRPRPRSTPPMRVWPPTVHSRPCHRCMRPADRPARRWSEPSRRPGLASAVRSAASC